MFDRLLLVSCICIVVATIFYFFYWNRFLGFLIGRAIRLLSWNKEASSIWVEIGSIHFSIIAGRILFKDVKYYSSNQTIKVVKGQIQWRYWIRKPTPEDEIGLYHNAEDGFSPSKRCRVHLSLQGFEWYLYNRTAAYDYIISRMQQKHAPDAATEPLSQKASRGASSQPFYPSFSFQRSHLVPRWLRRATTWVKRQLPNLDPKDLLPLGIEVQKGAIICGNASTANLLVSEFQRCEGTFGVVEARSKLDLYKQILSIKFHQAQMRLVENDDFVDPMAAIGELVNGRIFQYSAFTRPFSYLSHCGFVKLWDKLSLFALTKRYARDCREARNQRKHSHSCARKVHGGASHAEMGLVDNVIVEYAIERKILEASILELTYCYDIVGEVLPQASQGAAGVTEDTPPEWGINIAMTEAIIRYGPWADRQRAEIQRIFFPLGYQDGVVTKPAQPGDTRPWIALKIFVEFIGGTTLHIPFREASKGWQWDGQSEIPHQRSREPTMIHISAGERTLMTYTLPMTVEETGFTPIMELYLDNVLMTSTLNDIRLVAAHSCRIHGEFPTPVRWNEERTWSFTVSFDRPTLYLIRDHINMFTDLIRDWTAGPPTEYQRFVPMIYALQFDLHNYDINLYVNDHNIIDKPLFHDENALITVSGASFKVSTDIYANQYRPDSTSVPFYLDAPGLSLNLSLPRWNTNAMYDGKGGNDIARIGSLHMEGYYRYFAIVRDDTIEQLYLKFKLRDVAFKALGWAIRYFMVLRENYFGSFTNFSTLYEYLEKRHTNRSIGDPVMEKYRPGKSNMLQLEIQLVLEDNTVLLPASLTGSDSFHSDKPKFGPCVAMMIPEILLQLRIHDYYMDMSLNTSAISGGVLSSCTGISQVQPEEDRLRTLQIDGIHITANRLFGPAPRTSTYICIWEITVDDIWANPSASDGHIILGAMNSFRINYSDPTNAPAQEYGPQAEPDVTFVRVSVKSVRVTWMAGQAAMILSLDSGLEIGSNDLGGRYHRKVTSIQVPKLSIQVLLTTATHSLRRRWLEAARLTCDAYLDIYRSPEDVQELSRLQAEYIEAQDAMSGRACSMASSLATHGSKKLTTMHMGGLYLPHPMLPRRAKASDDLPYRHLTERNATETAQEDFDAYPGSDAEEDPVTAFDVSPLESRTATFSRRRVKHEDVNQEMSSGDESDNEDLTDASSDNEWSDPPTPSRHNPEDVACKLYSNVVDQYLYEPSGVLYGSSFALCRRSALLHSMFMIPPEVTRTFVDAQPPLHNRDRQHDSTTLRVNSKTGIDVLITPLLIFAGEHLKEDVVLNHSVSDAGLWIDSLMVQYLGAINSRADSKKSTKFKALIPFLSITVLQRLIMDKGRPVISDSPSSIESMGEIGLDVMAVLRTKLSDMNINGEHSYHKKTFELSCTRMSLDMDLSVDKRTISTPKPPHLLLGCTILGSSATFSDGDLNVCWEDFAVRMGHLGPEYLIATYVALISASKALANIAIPLMAYRASTNNAVIARIIRSSSDRATIDPLSTIQPSYLVQTGRPFSLRTDPAFRFLYHLRASLWHLSPEVDDNLPEQPQELTTGEFVSLIEDRLTSLDPDAYSPTWLVAIENLLSLSPSSAPADRRQSPFAASVHFTHTELTILDPMGHSSSILSISDLRSRVALQSGDLLRPHNHLASLSQTSLRERRYQATASIWVSVSCEDLNLCVSPHLMSFAQNLVRVRRFYYSRDTSKPPKIATTSSTRSILHSVVGTLRFQQLRIQAAAENLIFEVATNKVLAASNIVNKGQQRNSMTHTICFDEFSIRARTPGEHNRNGGQDNLAYVSFMDGKVNLSLRSEPAEKIARVFFTAGLQLSVPRSALRLYKFVEEWRADYLPGMEAMMQSLVAELNKTPPTKATKETTPSPLIEIEGHLSRIGISLQIMHGTWLSWTAKPSLGYAKSSSSSAHTEYIFGGQIGPMTLEISSTPNSSDFTADTRVKLSLPAIMITGQHVGDFIHVMGLVQQIDLKVKVAHWDTLLVVQQKFGQDFNDLLALVHKTQSARRMKKALPSAQRERTPLKYDGFLKIQGFRLALESPASTAFLECLDIGGGINFGDISRRWNMNLSDLALSLASHSIIEGARVEPSRNNRPAFVTIDISTRGGEKIWKGNGEKVLDSVQVSLTKIHAVMQPSSISQLGDFVDYLQVEILARKEQRVTELAAFKDKTRSILQTFEVGVKDLHLEKHSWLDRYAINVFARNVGVAFPLSADTQSGLASSRSSRKYPSTVPAFLWTIKSVEFSTHQAESGQFTMKVFALQFVSHFTQTDPSDYTAEKHETRNQLVYPEMEAQLRSAHTASSRQILISANVSGFILDLDSNIPTYVFSLVDVYRLGKDRVDKLSASLPRSHLQEDAELDLTRSNSVATGFSTSNISGSLIFASGKVRLYSRSASKQYKERTSKLKMELSDEQVTTEIGADVFNLPVVSLWTEYLTTSSATINDGARAEASLMFKATIHSSQNILRPNLLPFLTETVSHIEARMRKQNLASSSSTPSMLVDQKSLPTDTPVFDSAPSTLRISFSLRIDQSKLELTCQPDVNVVAGLHWNSGGFIINVSPGAQDVTFTGSVGGLTIGLKHGFLSEDCVKLDARNLAFSAAFSKAQKLERISPQSVSVVVETEFLGGVRFSRLQDILCFKAVWLDRIPIFNGQLSYHVKDPSRSPVTPRPAQQGGPKQTLNNIVLIRIRQIMLEVDLGQSISLLTLDLQDATMRTKLTEVMNEVSLSVSSFAINAKGNVGGNAHVHRCVFETTRSNIWDSARRAAQGKMLKLQMTSGPLVVSLQSDHQQLLHYRAEPLQVNIFDDWSVKPDSINTRETPLRLAFTVDSPEIVAVATIGTIPKLLAYVTKFKTNLEAQRQGAARESRTFRITRTPTPDNPLSAVAEAMLQSARLRFKEMGAGFSYVILQHMSLHLDLLRLIVFPRTMDDLEIAHFVGRDVEAKFDRLVESDEPSGKRDLLLSFSSISISKHTGLSHPPPAEMATKDDWLTSLLSHSSEAIIVGLPSMIMHMVSREIAEDQNRILSYDFHSRFVRHEEVHEEKDIYITLNMSLYSWLTLLRKSLTREMDQVRIASDWNFMLNSTTPEVGKPKKDIPEPLNIVDTPTSTLGHASNPQFSPFSPTTALRSATGISPAPLSGPGPFSAGLSPRYNTIPSLETSIPPPKNTALVYRPGKRHIERLRMRQLGEATPDVMHPFFMKTAGFNLEDSLPQYVNEYATVPLEEIMEFLLKLYSRQLLANR